MPTLRSDSKVAAVQGSSEFTDKRLSYFWDENQLTGLEWGKVLDLDKTAWDVYFLYGPNVKWKKKVPKPDFWMHQLSGCEDKAPFLDLEGLEIEVRKQLSAVKN